MPDNANEEEEHMKKVAVLGAGSWGTALAIVLADNGHDVQLWTYKEKQAKTINTTHKNEQYLDGIELPETIKAHHKFASAIQDVVAVLLVVPTNAVRELCQQTTDLIY